jgi:hypothetical protein
MRSLGTVHVCVERSTSFQAASSVSDVRVADSTVNSKARRG